jgi:LacI family transcriptional regulator
MAIGILKAIHDSNFRVPEDISVTGFDDIPLARYTIPSLTTIRQPIEKMAKRALEILMHQINYPNDHDKELFELVPPELVVRDSTGKASSKLQ